MLVSSLPHFIYQETQTRQGSNWCLLISRKSHLQNPHLLISGTKVLLLVLGLPQGLSGKESNCNVGNTGPIPGLGRSSGIGNGNPLQYSCLENPMDRGAWWATVHGLQKSWTWLTVTTIMEEISDCQPISILPLFFNNRTAILFRTSVCPDEIL